MAASAWSQASDGGEPARGPVRAGGDGRERRATYRLRARLLSFRTASSVVGGPVRPSIEYGLAAIALAAPISKTLTDAALIATGLLFLWDWREGRVRARRTPLDGAIALWAASQGLATLVSLEPFESLRELRNLGYWALFYLAAWGVAAGASLARVITLWLGAAVIAALQGLLEFAFGFDLLHPPSPTASGFFTGHLPFGHVQAMAFALALALLFESRTRREQMICAGLVTVFSAAVVASGGRGPWLALAVTAVVLALRGAPRRIFVVLAIVAAIQIAVVARQPAGLESFYRSYVVVDDETTGEVPDATVYSNLWRLTMWREGLRIFSLRPVLGTGVETTGALSREFRTPFVDFGVGHLHSNYAEIAMTRGFVGLTALFAVGLAFAATWRAAIPRLARGRPKAIVVAALGAIVLHAVHGLTYYSIGSTPIQMSFFLLSGLAAGVVLRDAPAVEAPLSFRGMDVALAVLAVGLAAWLAPLLAAAPRSSVAAALVVCALFFGDRLRGRFSLLEACLVCSFLVIAGGAVVLVAPLPSREPAALTIISAGAGSFVLCWIALRLVDAARGTLIDDHT